MNEKEILERLWEEYKLRQQHYWASFNRFALAIITINVVPYVKPDLAVQLGALVVSFPAAALLLSLVCTWFLGAEYQRLRMVRHAYDERFLPYGKIPRMPTTTRWERFVARRIGSSTSIIFGIGLTSVSAINMILLISLPGVVPAPGSGP